MLIFIGALVLAVAIGAVALREVGGTARSAEQVLAEHADQVIAVEQLRTLSERTARASRSFLLTGDHRLEVELRESRQTFKATTAMLRGRLADEQIRRLLDLVDRLEQTHQALVDDAMKVRAQRSPTQLVSTLERQARPTREQLDLALAALSESEQREFAIARAEAQSRGRGSLRLLLVVSAGSVVLSAALAWLLRRTLAGLQSSRRALDASLAHLERANRDLDAFAGRIAHDLRNVLAPLPLNAERLRRRGEQREAVESVADKIERVGRRADGLIEALLAFARAGQPPDVTAAASIRRAVSEAVEDVNDLRSMVDGEVIVDVEDLDVRCGESLLGTVVTNLLTNALKFVEGRPERRVHVVARRSGPLCELTVSDTGPGIPAEAQARIFEPFFRAPDAKGRGTGIGLATVQRIVEAHGGRIAVQSTAGPGATFVIRLPLARSSEEATPASPLAETQALH